MRRTLATFSTPGWALAWVVACLPLASITTLLLLPVWRWIEAQWGIETVGHSGPADWCFALVYAGWVGLGVMTWHQKRSQNRED
jgi:hypothetical protein